ncbi:hypothetical protein PoB_002760400, partial [Plakobranchus ocellatus]
MAEKGASGDYEQSNEHPIQVDKDNPAVEGESNHEMHAVPSSESSASPINASKPTCIVVLGMAGSGKTSFVQ